MKTKIKFKKFGKLPGQPSKLIRLALKDLAKVEKAKKKYRVDMAVWYQPNGKCSVCFAGAVISQELLTAPLKKKSLEPEMHWNADASAYVASKEKAGLSPGDFKNERNALNALDEFRQGSVLYGLHYLGLRDPGYMNHFTAIAPYPSRGKFRRDMEKMAAMLEKAGY